MKVKEIIIESRILQEQMLRFGMLLNYAIKTNGKGISGLVEKALEWLARNVKNSPKAADELAAGWVKTAQEAEVGINSAIRAGQEAAEAAGIPKSVLDDAAALAIRKYGTKLGPKIRNSMEAAQIWWGAGLSSINSLLMWFGVLQPIAECVYYILLAYKKRDEGHPEYQSDKKLQWVVQFEINKALAEVSAILIARGTLAWALGPNGIQRLGPLGWGPIGKAFNLLNPAAQATFQAWFLSPPGQEAFSQWLVGNSILAGGKEYKAVVDFVGGHVVKTGYDAILRALGSDKAQQPPRTGETKPFKSALDNMDLGHGFKKD